jgi:hypothetical protein
MHPDDRAGSLARFGVPDNVVANSKFTHFHLVRGVGWASEATLPRS